MREPILGSAESRKCHDRRQEYLHSVQPSADGEIQRSDHVRAAAVAIVFEKDVAIMLQDGGIGRKEMAVL